MVDLLSPPHPHFQRSPSQETIEMDDTSISRTSSRQGLLAPKQQDHPPAARGRLAGAARHTLGLILLLCVVFLWTLSNFLGSVCYTPLSVPLCLSARYNTNQDQWLEHLCRQHLRETFLPDLPQHLDFHAGRDPYPPPLRIYKTKRSRKSVQHDSFNPVWQTEAGKLYTTHEQRHRNHYRTPRLGYTSIDR